MQVLKIQTTLLMSTSVGKEAEELVWKEKRQENTDDSDNMSN